MKNNTEKSYADKVRELEKAQEELKEACEKAVQDFFNSLAEKVKLYNLLDWITRKFKNS